MLHRLLALTALVSISAGALAQSWLCYGGNPQHSGVFSGGSQAASLVKWQTPLDDDRGYYGFGSDVLIHFAAPMVTSANTVVHGFRFTAANSTGASQYDNWRVYGRSGHNGSVVWQLATDYSAAVIYPNDWTSVFPLTLFQSNSAGTTQGVAVAGGGGSILVRSSADAATSTVTRIVFYTSATDYNNNKAAYAPVKINTPLTADGNGNIYFGYEVTGPVPANLTPLGTGGIAKVNVNTGAALYRTIFSYGLDPLLTRMAVNAAPALSNDGSSIYLALSTGGYGENPQIISGAPQLAKVSTSSLALQASVQMLDPSIANAASNLIQESSASPMVGPDGHVFMGVFGNQWRESHGWMLQYDANLNQTDSKGNQYPVGAFGWDDTASVVPASCVPSYKGKASYLILTKYNNYDDNGSDPGADGSNKVAVLDPTSNSVSKDRQSGIPVMNEILTVLGPTKTNNDSQHPNAVNEWCINSAAIDVNSKSAIINSEDGHMYRWSFVTNTVTQVLDLQPATGEAYTETAIGPDGQLYVINNMILFAIGSNNATSVSVFQGSNSGIGILSNIWYTDGLTFSTGSVMTASGPTAAIEADFGTTTTKPSSISITASAAAAASVTGQIFLYNYSTGVWDLLSNTPLSSSQTAMTGTTSTSVTNYINSAGNLRVLIRGICPGRLSISNFNLAVDLVSCGVN